MRTELFNDEKYGTSNARPVPSKEELQELFDYDDSGFGYLRWKIKTKNNKNNIGDIAGFIKKNGYSIVGIDNKEFPLHRIIYQWHFGDLRQDQIINHIDSGGEGSLKNNRISNLEACTQRQNMQWSKGRKNNKSGFNGVFFDIKNKINPWRARYKDENCKRVERNFNSIYEAYHWHAENSARVMGCFYKEKKLSVEDRHAYMDWLLEQNPNPDYDWMNE